MYKVDYVPKSFCREFTDIKGNSLQISMYMALVLGHKPLMDDWIHHDKLVQFKRICRQYKIHIREDAVFLNINKSNIPAFVIGKDSLTSTSAYGAPLNAANSGEVHVFLSMNRSLLKKGMWYPLIAKDRVIFQPRADSLNYGHVLGYPDCCIKFFRKFNNWFKYSYLYEIYKNTKQGPSFLCNPFLKDMVYSYIYHMPCSYDCKDTIRLAGNLRKDIKKREPDFVRFADTYLKMPFLVFCERKVCCFDGDVVAANVIRYRKAHFVKPDISKDIYGADLSKADMLELRGREILLSRNGKPYKTIVVPLSDFAPEYPFIIQFL